MPPDLLHGFQLGPWKVEPLRGAVTGPNGVARHLEPKVMDVFVCLARHANEVVTREELLEAVWNGRAVTDESPTRAIRELRHALKDIDGDSDYIETVPKRGYCLIGDIFFPDGSRLEHEPTDPQSVTRVTQIWFAIAVVAVLSLVLIYFGYDKFVVAPAREEALATSSPQVEEQGRIDGWEASIAVLPFVNMSDDPSNEYFSDGLTEEIRTLLAKIPGLKVIGRTSSFAFKGQNQDLRRIGDTLDVEHIMEGSVRTSGDRVRITAQLIDVSDGAHIWSETFDRTMTDIFAVQDEVAAAIIDALQISVAANPSRGRPTGNAKAYALFLKARTSFSAFDLRDAEEFLFQAIELDPMFAEAYELLAATYARRGGDTMSAADGQKLTLEAAAKALSIDPNLAFAQALYQLADMETFSFFDVLDSFERVLREQPSNTEPLGVLAWELFQKGYVQESLGFAQRNVDLDPLWLAARYRVADAFFAVGRTSEAVNELEFADQLGGGYAKWGLGEANIVEKQDDVAIAYFEALHKQAGLPTNWIREMVTAARDPATGQAYLDRHIPEIVASTPERFAYQWQLLLTKWYLLFGFLDRYFELILANDLAVPTWNDSEVLIHGGIKYRRLGFTMHPNYLEVAEAMGSVDVWEQRGPPDFCNKVDGQWVCQ